MAKETLDSPLARAQRALDEHLEANGPLICPLCAGKEWGLIGLTSLALNEQPEYTIKGAPVLPMAIASCSGCSRLEFFGTAQWGL